LWLSSSGLVAIAAVTPCDRGVALLNVS
jgi:hypothetical protein